MKQYNVNVIAVFDEKEERLLMCRRRKEPYKGLSNLVGGKIEDGEDGLDAAYRELWEETSITREDIKLIHVMDFTYHLSGCRLEVYAGKLRGPVEVAGDENELYWSGLDENYFDMSRYAGEGNIGHILEQIKFYREKLFDR